MVTSSGSGWARARYPLQTTSKSSTGPQSATISVEDTAKPFSHTRRDINAVDGEAPWYRAVTYSHDQQYTLVPRFGSEANMLSREQSEEVYTTDKSVTAVPRSQRSPLSSVISHDGPASEETESLPTFVKVWRQGRDESAYVWKKQAQNGERNESSVPVENTTSAEEKSPTMSHMTTLIDDSGQSFVERLKFAQEKAAQRTLRRSWGSLRVNPPRGSAEEEQLLSPQSERHESSTTASKTKSSPQYTDTRNSPASISETSCQARSSSQDIVGQAKEVYFDQVRDNQQWASLDGTHSSNSPLIQSTALATAALSTEGKLEPDETSTNQQLETHQAARVSRPSQRIKYPLQKPISVADMRSPPTPTASSLGYEGENPSQRSLDNMAVEDVRKSKVLRRRVYPMQTPVSIGNLRHTASTYGRVPKQLKIAIQNEGPVDVTDRSELFRQQGYPLEPPINVSTLQQKQQQNAAKTGLQTQTIDFESAVPEKLHDQVYPIQGNKKFRRRGYPLQASNPFMAPLAMPAPSDKSDAVGERAPVGSTSECSQILKLEAQDNETSIREKELAAKVINQWRRLSYPLQSPRAGSPFDRSSPPTPLEERKTRPAKIHLPKHIRAVKDADLEETKSRTIVVCLDGTGDKFDNDNSNIVHIVSALKKDDPYQVTYYQAGIGTYSSNGLSSGFAAAADMAVGAGLGLHVRDAYHFLMHTYKEGDKICIFGFSRGAYTARCLAGMIHKVGLLPPRNIQQIPFAYEFYTQDTAEGWKQSQNFKDTFCIDVCVYFLGCFDSVASVGFIPRQLPLSGTPTTKARYFRHAMALDERRAKFKICRHQARTLDSIEKPVAKVTNEVARLVRSNPPPPYSKNRNDAPPGYHQLKRFDTFNHPNVTDEEYADLKAHEAPFDTDVLEVWFAGAHADIGGGAVPNDERHKLAQIPLRWMMRQAFDCDTGIIFKTKVLAEFGLDVHTLWPQYERLPTPSHGPPPSFLEKYDKELPPRSVRRNKLVPIDEHKNGEPLYHLKGHLDIDWTPEQVEDFYDAMSPLNDQLLQAPTWWILEALPVQYKVPVAPGQVQLRVGPNWGRYRGVDDYEPKVHWTVLHRAQHIGYKVQARTAAHTTWKAVA